MSYEIQGKIIKIFDKQIIVENFEKKEFVARNGQIALKYKDGKITAEKKMEKAKCKGLKKQEKEDCLESAQTAIDNLNDSLFSKKNEVDSAKSKNKSVVKEINKLKKSLSGLKMRMFLKSLSKTQ